MNTRNVRLTLTSLFLGVILFSCDQNENISSAPQNANAVIKSTEYTQWSYFDFEQGKTTATLPIVKKSGTAVGGYTGSWSYTLMGTTSQEEVLIDILPASGDSVKIFGDFNLAMGSDVPVSLSSYAIATPQDDHWVLTMTDYADNLVDPDGDGVMSNYKMKINGIVGAKGDSVKLNIDFILGDMPMPIQSIFASEVKYNYFYSVEDEQTHDWDIAFHLYDVRTNGLKVARVQASSLEDVKVIPDQSLFVADQWAYVMADLSNMMDNFVGYHFTTSNPNLYHWVKRTPTGGMPPVRYQLDEHAVFVIQRADHTYVKVKFTDFTNDKGEDVYPAFEYAFFE